MNMAATTTEAGGGKRSAPPASGLVSSRTTGHVVPLGPTWSAERRVRRLKRSVWAAGHLHGIADVGKRAPAVWFVTLTYRGVEDWRADHVKEAIRQFRRYCQRNKVACRYVWVAELQVRGAVHYHLLAWLPHGLRMPQWDRAGWWQHGMTNTQEARAGVGYLMKYLSKLGCLTVFPKGLRLYGIGGLSRDGRNVRSWLNLPMWARRAFGVGDLGRVAAAQSETGRAGLVVHATGELLRPVYSVSRVPGGLLVRQLRELPARFGLEAGSVGAFSTWPRAA